MNAIEVGDIVQLKSGGPKMTVSAISTTMGGDDAARMVRLVRGHKKVGRPFSVNVAEDFRLRGEPRMSWSTRNAGTEWTSEQDQLLKKLAKQDTPTPVIGFKIGRTPGAIYTRASELGVSLMPPNPHHKKK